MPKKLVISTVHAGPSLGGGKRDLLNLMGFIAESFLFLASQQNQQTNTADMEISAITWPEFPLVR
jgi:hypothetical protein